MSKFVRTSIKYNRVNKNYLLLHDDKNLKFFNRKTKIRCNHEGNSFNVNCYVKDK